ncbi:Poly(ADP-ribose) polymerase and DNA-Ligase Zn-finger region [Ostertagia ostertagi]
MKRIGQLEETCSFENVVERTMDPVEFKNLPFGVEYARSSRSSCKGCKDTIVQDSLRMSVREPSRFFDGLQDNWFHFACFWKRIKPGKVQINERSIRGMDGIKWDDQEKIREKIKAFMSGGLGGLFIDNTFSSLKVEYAKSSRGKCFACKLPIAQKEVKFGKLTNWYHQQCLFKNVKYGGSIEDIGGFSYLNDEDQQKLLISLREFAKEDKTGDVEDDRKYYKCKQRKMSWSPAKKPRVKQTDMMWELRSGFKENLTKHEMMDLLISNDLTPPSGESKILDYLVDCAMFGCCKPCSNSSLRTYRCNGQLSEYTKCTYRNENPDRIKFTIPKDMKENAYLKNLKVNLMPKRVYNELVAKETIVDHSDAFKRFGSRGITNFEAGDVEGKSMGVGSGLSKQLVKGGTVVDQECEYSEVSHVHRDAKGALYSVVLGSVDLQTNRNSYYKIQLLKNDTKPTFYLFRSWGRVGTAIGGTRTELFRSEGSATEAFERSFLRSR